MLLKPSLQTEQSLGNPQTRLARLSTKTYTRKSNQIPHPRKTLIIKLLPPGRQRYQMVYARGKINLLDM